MMSRRSLCSQGAQSKSKICAQNGTECVLRCAGWSHQTQAEKQLPTLALRVWPLL